MLTLRLHPDHKSLTDFVTCGVPVVRVRREYANSNIKDVSGGYPDAGLHRIAFYQSLHPVRSTDWDIPHYSASSKDSRLT